MFLGNSSTQKPEFRAEPDPSLPPKWLLLTYLYLWDYLSTILPPSFPRTCSVLKPNFRTFVSQSLTSTARRRKSIYILQMCLEFRRHDDELAHVCNTMTIWPLSKWTSVKNSLVARLSCNYINTLLIENAIFTNWFMLEIIKKNEFEKLEKCLL